MSSEFQQGCTGEDTQKPVLRQEERRSRNRSVLGEAGKRLLEPRLCGGSYTQHQHVSTI